MVDSTAAADGTPSPRAGDPTAVAGEVRMARLAVRVGALVSVPVVVVAALLRGTAGALTALGAVAMVVGLFAVTGHLQAWAARRGPEVLFATVLGGFVLRLVLYAAAIVVLRPVAAIDGEVLAISTAVALVAVLVFEVRFALARQELWWVDAGGDAEERP